MRKGDDMDMNWQTMLHEAANASFEKDIEVRSAADNDAYSCVDLPKAKIRELSEKILHLPHQGIVLLFSRYCFRLSPQETEKFFQMKNAKGRFRFYRELLSTSMGLSSEQVISDASLNRACKIAMKDYLRTELKEDAAVSSTGKSRTHIVFRRFGKAVAVAAITITLLFSTAMVTNAKIREKVIAWIVETFEKYSIFELQSDGENTKPDLQSYKPTYLPDGAELKNTVEQPEMLAYEYAINESSYFNILLSKSDTRIYADAENTEIESFDKDGVIGYYFKKDDLNYICYERDGDFFSIYGSIDMDELIARIVSLIRRYTRFNQQAGAVQKLDFDGLQIDLENRSVTTENGTFELPPKEFDLLLYCAKHQGKILTKQQIYEEVWGEEYFYDDSNIMAIISRLRKKLEVNPSSPKYIQTVKGIGYRFNKEV